MTKDKQLGKEMLHGRNGQGPFSAWLVRHQPLSCPREGCLLDLQERERERESWHSKPPALSYTVTLSLALWWQRLSLGTISPMLRKGHQLPYDTLHYLPPVSSTTSPPCSARLYGVGRIVKGSLEHVQMCIYGLSNCQLCMFEIITCRGKFECFR